MNGAVCQVNLYLSQIFVDILCFVLATINGAKYFNSHRNSNVFFIFFLSVIVCLCSYSAAKHTTIEFNNTRGHFITANYHMYEGISRGGRLP